MRPDPPFGVYVHVPFCRARCDYCAFATYTDRDHLMEAYAAACVTELGRAVDEEGMPPATSVFFGGGTPSRLPADLLAAILDAVPRRPGAEVTVECNPEDVDPARLAAYRAAGVTRISLGVQSTVPHVLAGLGRRHGSDQVAEAAEAVAGGRLRVVEHGPDHRGRGRERRRLGAEPRRRARTGLAPAPPERLLPHRRARHPAGRRPGPPPRRRRPGRPLRAGRPASSTDAGYRWEEISNWALPGHGCRHNRLYWEQGDYRGIGSAAHSHRAGRRWWNVRTPDRYVAAVEAGRPTPPAEEVLTDEQRRFEALALALRTPAGVPLDALPDDPDLEGLVDRSQRPGGAHRPGPAAGQRGDRPSA